MGQRNTTGFGDRVTIDANAALVRQAIFQVLDEREWDFTDDEQRVDFADRVTSFIPVRGAMTFAEWWAKNGYGYTTTKELARNAWFGAAGMYASLPSTDNERRSSDGDSRE